MELLWIQKNAQSTSLSHSEHLERIQVFSQAQRTSRLVKPGTPNRKKSAKTMALMAAGEMIADKLPFIPSRTAMFPLVARVASGALSGTAFVKGKKRSTDVAEHR